MKKDRLIIPEMKQVAEEAFKTLGFVNKNREVKMSDKQKIANLQNALGALRTEYLQYVDNACHCESDDENEYICPYCYAEMILKVTK